MRKSYLLFVLTLCLVIHSCSNDDHINPDGWHQEQFDEKDISVVDLSASNSILKSSSVSEGDHNDLYVLKFKDEQTYLNTLEKLRVSSTEERTAWASAFPNFISVVSVYEEAMRQADSLSFDNAEEYLAFKQKYNCLYFPEYKDDYGTYVPYADEIVASILNRDGKVIIGDKLHIEKRISSYEELRQTGRAYYEKDIEINPEIQTKSLRASTVNVPWRTIRSKNHIEEYSSGWQKVGKGKKIKLNFGIRNMIVKDRGICFHSEVSFRKKGFLGKWYNYSSYTSLRIRIYKENIPEDVAKDINKILSYPQNSYERSHFSFNYSHTGTSSHDHYITVPADFYLYQNGKSNIIKGYQITATLDYRGMSGYTQYRHTFNRSYSKLDENKTFWQIVSSVVNPVLKFIFVGIAEQIGEALGDSLSQEYKR